jgi:diguanylate cyclase (GGDEF)-like protein
MSITKKHSVKTTIITTLISFIVFSALYHIILYHELAADKERYSYIAKNQAEHIITTVDCVMSRTNTLTIMVKENNGDTAWFDIVAEDIYTSVKDETGISLKNFAIAPGGVVSNVYPLEGNEELIGFDFFDTSRTGNLEAKEAYENGKTIITNPFELIQGGTGMGGRTPVVLQSDDGTAFWGIVTVTIDFDNLIEVLGLDNLKGMGVDYSLAYIDSDGRSNFICGDENLGNNTVKTRFNVRNLTWEIEVKPSKGWVSIWKIIFSTLIILALSCAVGAVSNMMSRVRNINTLLLSLSVTDALTECSNRRAYDDKLRELALQEIDDDFVCVSVDLNGLKQINDSLGHDAGDEAIRGVSKCLQKGFGPYGNLYRTGGDEFVALIWAKEEPLEEIIEKVNSIINDWKGQIVDKISVSIGYASHREFPDRTINELSRIADVKMYEAKSEYYRNNDRDRR